MVEYMYTGKVAGALADTKLPFGWALFIQDGRPQQCPCSFPAWMSGSQAAVLGDNEPTVALLQAVWKIGFSYWQLIFPESMSRLVVGVSPFL